MSAEKYYPNFTDEELEIGWLSDLAEVTLYLQSGRAMLWARSQKRIWSPWQRGECPLLKQKRRVCGLHTRKETEIKVSSALPVFSAPLCQA